MHTPSDYVQPLLDKFQTHSAKVGVVGLGYVGLPFAIEQAKRGFSVLGIDQNPQRVQQLKSGCSYIADVSPAELQQAIQNGRFKAAVDFESVPELDVLVICVPTPLTRKLIPDLKHVEKVAAEVSARLRPGQLIVLESTTYPGTTEEIMLPLLEKSGLKVEQEFFLAYSPERVSPGDKSFTTRNTSKVVGGIGPHSLLTATSFYSATIDKVVPVTSASVAEMVKVFENSFRAVNIALVNELMLLCDKMKISVWEVLDAAFTKPFGIMPFYPGPGVGGHCIPLDPHYLEWKAKQFNFDMHFISVAGEINRKMPAFVVEKAVRLLNTRGLAPSRSKILVMGVSYKKDISDCRESPSVDIIRLFQEQGAWVRYYDPFVPCIEIDGTEMKSLPRLPAEQIAQSDLVVIVTDHSAVDYTALVTHAQCVLDTRNATKSVREHREKITLL